MKRVEVLMKSSFLDTFKDSATRLGISEYEVSDVRLSPSSAVRERRRRYRGQEYTLDLLSGVKVEFVTYDEEARRVAENILAEIAADSIAIFSLDEIIRISTIAGHRVSLSRTERGDYEIANVTH
jgi:nitrogen regulatory protein PII